MQHDILKSGIAVVAMRAPSAGADVHFHIASLRPSIRDLDDRAAKIRSSFQAVKTRMEHAHLLAIEGFELITEQSLVLPDGLKQAFGRRVGVFAQKRGYATAHAPLGVEAVKSRRHRGIACAPFDLGSQGLGAEF